MRATSFITLLLLGTLMSCAAPEPQQIQVGSHSVSIVFPGGWEHIDYGKRHHLKKGLEKIALDDLGPRSALIDEALPGMLAALGHTSQRDIASKEMALVNGREVTLVDTWDRLSHDHRKRYAFVYNENRVLAVHTGFGKFEKMEEAFDELVMSLAIMEASADSTASTAEP